MFHQRLTYKCWHRMNLEGVLLMAVLWQDEAQSHTNTLTKLADIIC